MRCAISFALALIAAPQDTDVDRLIEQLRAPTRAERLDARRKLLALGADAVEKLEAPGAEFEVRETLRYLRSHLPRLPETVTVAAGKYEVGSDNAFIDRNPVREVQLPEFRIDVNEVTCFDYFRFVQATKTRAPVSWDGGIYPYGAERYPVSGITFAEAQAFSRWVGGRLPTADEWEVAAHLGDRRAFPWGDQVVYQLRNLRGAPVPVASEERDHSPSGCFDMGASLREWVTLGDKAGIRGGHFLSSRMQELRLTRRPDSARSASEARRTIGFRVVNRQR